jgi:hypothetical protein
LNTFTLRTLGRAFWPRALPSQTLGHTSLVQNDRPSDFVVDPIGARNVERKAQLGSPHFEIAVEMCIKAGSSTSGSQMINRQEATTAKNSEDTTSKSLLHKKYYH